MRIVLHAGTPKTGSTSLQFYFSANRARLMSHGILYPSPRKTYALPIQMTKHKELVEAIRQSDSMLFADLIESSLAESRSDTHTIVLSNESIYVFWPELSRNIRAALRELGRRHQLQIWLWLRDPVSFARSRYIQLLKNTKVEGTCHGTSASLDEILEAPWFSRQLDYGSFVRDVVDLLGADALRLFAYDGSTISQFLGALGCAEPVAEARRNAAIGALGCQLLRVVNRHAFTVGDKMKIVDLVETIDAMHEEEFVLGKELEAKIVAMTAPSMSYLRDAHGLRFPCPSGTDLPSHRPA